MASIDELERLDREIREADQRALQNLAEHLREAVRDMPSESKLALAFVRYARKFEMWANDGVHGDIWGMSSLHGLEREAGEIIDDDDLLDDH